MSSMKSLTSFSPAKLNLYLQVVNKRPDQFHNLITLFERIDLGDEIIMKLNPLGEIRISCDYPGVPNGKKNLVYQVARLLKDDFRVKEGVDIKIQKRIPVAAGLAGGSSNGATVLLGLNKLWGLGLPFSKLVSYARQVGSDVAFFLHEVSWAWGTGRGDIIRPLNLPSRIFHVLVVPRLKVYSREVFANLKLKLTKKKADVSMLPRALRKNDLLQAGQLLRNDLDETTFRLYPQLLYLKDRLDKLGAWGVCLSGSGPSLFGLTDSRAHAEEIKSQLANVYKQVFVVRTL